MDKIILDRSKLLGFDHPSNLKAKVGDKTGNVSNQPEAKPEISGDRSRAAAR